MQSESLKGHLDALILAVVATAPSHGYALIEELKLRSGGSFDLPEGTVYPALHRLERAGLLASSWAEASGRRRRVYRLTPQGAARAGDAQGRVAELRARGRGGAGVIEELRRELVAAGIRGALRDRIVAEIADHLDCDPAAEL